MDLHLPQSSTEKPHKLHSTESDVIQIGPIEQKMRSNLDRLRGTKYRDTFDWSIYDKIAARFGDNQPRGGVVFNTGLKLVNHHASCTKCHYAFEIDSYGRGCIHNCTYCYAKEHLYGRKYWNEPMPFPVNLAEIRKVFHTVFETNKRSSWRKVLEARIPLRIGSMSDSFMWMDRKYKVTQELLRILNFYEYPHIVFTRSDLIAEDEYIALLDPRLVSVQMSISGGNVGLTKIIEPGAPSVTKRLTALRKLADAGLWTTVRINPLFPIYPDGYFSDPKYITTRFGSLEAAPKFDLFDWAFIEELKDAKVPSVLAGFVRLSTWAINNLERSTGVNFREFFRPELHRGNVDRRYSDSEIAFYYKKLQAECAKHGIRFNTCYIGNGEKDYFQYQSLWSNKLDCCDARGNVNAFQRSSQEVPWEERLVRATDRAAAEKARELERVAEEAYQSSQSDQPGLTVTNAKMSGVAFVSS